MKNEWNKEERLWLNENGRIIKIDGQRVHYHLSLLIANNYQT